MESISWRAPAGLAAFGSIVIGLSLSCTSSRAATSAYANLVAGPEFDYPTDAGVAITWSAKVATLAPPYRIDPRKLRVRLTQVAPRMGPTLVLHGPSSPIAANQVDMTMDKSTTATVDYGTIRLAPGTYRVDVVVGGALTSAAGEPLMPAGSTQVDYFFVPPGTRADRKRANAALEERLQGKAVVLESPLALQCWGWFPASESAEKGERRTVLGVSDNAEVWTFQGAIDTRVAPRGSATSGPGPTITWLDPVTVAFPNQPSGCQATTVFRTAADVSSYLRIAP